MLKAQHSGSLERGHSLGAAAQHGMLYHKEMKFQHLYKHSFLLNDMSLSWLFCCALRKCLIS